MTSGTALNLGVTAADMVKLDSYEEAQNNYYATISTTTNEPALQSNHTTDENYFSIAKVALKDGDQGAKYHCTAQIQVSVTGLEDGEQMPKLSEQLQTEDGMLSLKFENNTTAGNITANLSENSNGEPGTTNTSLDLKNLASIGSTGKKYYLSYDFTRGTGEEDTADLQASFRITNTEKDQSYLAGKNIVITIKTVENDGDLKCEIVKDAE